MNQHDQIITDLISNIKRTGITDIKTSLSGWNKPDGIQWEIDSSQIFFPDIVTTHFGQIEIYKVETDESIKNQNIEIRLRTLKEFADKERNRFILVIPKTSTREAQNLLNRLNLNIEIYAL